MVWVANVKACREKGLAILREVKESNAGIQKELIQRKNALIQLCVQIAYLFNRAFLAKELKVRD